MKHKISIDFDNTLVEPSRFIAPHIINGKPEPGAKEALIKLSEYFEIIIFSCRAAGGGGKEAIADWMKKYEIPYSLITNIKLPSLFYVDDRSLNYNGDWKSVLHTIATREVAEPGHDNINPIKKEDSHDHQIRS